MEVIQIACITLYECGKYMFTGKFNHKSFWYKCIWVNPIYTKLFQAIAAKYSIHAGVHTIPYTSDEIVYPVGVLEPKIIGTGLISIVFEGVYDGQTVVVKTKRKNIEHRIHDSLASMRRIISWIHWIHAVPVLTSAYEEIVDIFKEQLDYCQEAVNQKKFKTLFMQHQGIHIPTILDCSNSQIIMTKLENIPLELLSSDEKRASALQLTDLIVHSLFNGLVHLDLHIGNILFSSYNIGIIDFGCMIQLTNQERDLLIDLLKAFVLLDFHLAAKHTMEFIEPIAVIQTLSPEIILDIQSFIIHTYLRATCIDHCFSVYDLIEISTKLRKYNLSLSPLFSKMAISLHSIETVLTQVSATPSDIMMQAVLTMLNIDSD